MPDQPQTPKKNVLVVEDETLLLQAIGAKLNALGLDTILCTTGRQAFDYLSNLPRLPDLIWLDFHVQDMDGIQFMSEMKKNDKWKDIPVVVVSNTASRENVQNMVVFGIKKYIVKAEYRLEDITQEVAAILNSPQTE